MGKYVQTQSPWIQAAGVTGDAAATLGTLMTQLPVQKQMMQERNQLMQERQQQMGQQQQMNPLLLQQERGKIGMQSAQGDLLQQRAALMEQQAGMLQSKQAELEQKTAAIASFLQQNPQAAAMMYSKQPQFREGGGLVYDAFTGQPTAQRGAVLNPGQVQLGAGLVGGAQPPVMGQSPFAPKQANPFANMPAAAMHAFGSGVPMDQVMKAMTNIMSALPNGGGGMPQRDIRSNALPQIQTPVPSTNAAPSKRWQMDSNGNLKQVQ